MNDSENFKSSHEAPTYALNSPGSATHFFRSGLKYFSMADEIYLLLQCQRLKNLIDALFDSLGWF
ncbi:MAG: hypothetical protein WAX69_25880 [Victivallales bacterium]